MKEIKIVHIFVFSALLLGGFLPSLVMPEKEYSVVENRELAQKPKFTKKKFLKGKYQKKYETYLNDQFIFRDQWVDMAVSMQYVLGKKDINGVYIGKKGYLLEKYKDSDFDRDQVEENIGFLSVFLNTAENIYGKGHVSALMVPSKTEAMSNCLPLFAESKSQQDTLAALRQKLSNTELLLDIAPAMKQKQEEYTYYRTDHHWTTLGAYYAYREWAEKTGMSTAYEIEHYQRETIFSDFYGTTYNKVHIRVPKDKVELFHTNGEENIQVIFDKKETYPSMYYTEEAKQGFNRYNVFFLKNTFQVEVDTKAGTGKTLLLIKDSFANCFVPFLTEDYDRIIMIDYRYGKTSIGRIMSENEDITDVLVLFNTEKFMENTKLEKLADTEKADKKSETMEEFNLDDFME